LDIAVALKHLTFASPIIPVNPVKHDEQELGTFKHTPRLRRLQNERDAPEQFTALTVDAMLFTACTAPSTLPDENELAKLEVSTAPTSVSGLS
jgi:hypothetical protein